MDQATQIREKIDIVQLISEYIPLRKMGRNFKTNCPFHNEKSPSFVVSPERQIWHCFGCGKGGDCFSFVMEYENLDFVEALKTLGKKTGIEVEFSSHDRGVSSQKENQYRANKLAADFYHYILTKHAAGKKALEYLTEKRKINPKVIETFRLGFAPTTSGALSKYLIDKKGYKKQDLLDVGLSTLRNGALNDFFFNRIMFPLFDHRDNIVGFSGRVMEDNPATSKYINTKETLVYHKGDVFFGLNNAKGDIKRENTVLIMEGEFDVISAFQQGVGNAVAIKGTALTENQAALIARFVPKVILCFDQDSAGFEALKRSLPILEKKGLTTSVLVLENAKDPDEAIKDNPIAFKKSVAHPLGVYDFLLEKTITLFDKKTAEGKKKISDELIPLFGTIENEIIKEHYVKKLSAELETSWESMYRQLEKYKKEEPRLISSLQQKDQRKREEVLEQYILALILQAENTKELLEKTLQSFSKFEFSTPAYKKIIEHLQAFFKNKDTFDGSLFVKALPAELVSAFDSCYLFPLSKFENKQDYATELQKTITQLAGLYVREKMKEISEKIKLKEKEQYEKKEEELEKLQKDFAEYVALLNSTKNSIF